MATFPIKGLPPIPTDQDYYNFNITSTANSTSPTPFSVSTWQELIASTSENWAGFTFYSSQQYGGIISFAVGSAGNEVKIADLRRPGFGAIIDFHIPIPVAAGSRLSIHFHNDANSGRTMAGFIIPQLTSDVAMNPPYTRLDCGPFEFPDDVNNWGNGTLVDTSGTAHVWGPWTELTQPTYTDNVLDGSSIPYQYKWLGLSFRAAGGTVSKSYAWELAYGSAGSETKVIEGSGLWKQSYVSEFAYSQITWIKWDRPAGDRISVRTRCDDIDANRRLSWFHLWGLL